MRAVQQPVINHDGVAGAQTKRHLFGMVAHGRVPDG
jgi:hypothetical protein